MGNEDRSWILLGERRVPRFLYGTAWKEDATEQLVGEALAAGFVGIDTANQRKHYHEAGVGAALRTALSSGRLKRDELFIQTKFTSLSGQDERLPYQADAPPQVQVMQSFARSLEHLGVSHVDSYVLHGPSLRLGLSEHDWLVWRAMERLHEERRVGFLGISNVTLAQLEALCDDATVAPRFVQNRCYARAGWDHDVRAYCRRHGLVYQGFSLLTANQREIASQPFQRLCQRLGRTPAQVVFQFAVAVGMQPLTGTSDPRHMREDLAILAEPLSADALEQVENIARA